MKPAPIISRISAEWTSFSSTGETGSGATPPWSSTSDPTAASACRSRRESPKGQKYSVFRSLYRQQELIFVAADERDVILRRTKYSERQWAYLYRLNSSVEELRRLFLDYVNTINQLYETPRWYHVLFTNCTTSFYKLPSTKVRWDWRVIANARLDRALYRDGRLDRTLPFKELRRLAYLNDIANAAPAAGFGDHIRRELERRRHER